MNYPIKSALVEIYHDGDINIDDDLTRACVSWFANNSSSLIDHVYLTNPELLLSCFTTSPLHFSDHNCLNISLKVYSHPVAFKRRDVWRYKHGDFEKANDLLSCFPDVDFRNASSLWSHWKVFFLSTIRQCIPSKNVFIRSAPRWLTSDIKRLIKCKSRLFRRAKRSNSIQVWGKFKSTRNKLVSAVRSAKGAYFRKLVSDFNSPQDFWSHYHSLKSTTSHIPIVLYNGHMSILSTTEKSNLLNSFFTPGSPRNRNLLQIYTYPLICPSLIPSHVLQKIFIIC